MSELTDHFDRLAELLALEREAEKEESRRRLEQLPLATREALGQTVTRLTIDGAESDPAGYTRLVLSRAVREERLAPFHGMNQGDNIRLSFPSGTRPAFVDGTLDRVEEYRAAVAVDSLLPEPLPAGRCVIDLLGSDATYRRMRKALKRAAHSASDPFIALRGTLLGTRRSVASGASDPEFFDPDLNRWQKDAVRTALDADEVSVVHGPPGTGKTTVLVEIIRQAVARGERVLATAPSNIAVDNILEKLLPEDGGSPRVVRLGHPARTLESLRHGTLRAQTAVDEQFVQVEEMDSWRGRLAKKLARRGSRGLSGAEREDAKREVHRLWKEARKLELAISRRLCLSAQVVISTHGGISSHILRGAFDWVVLDEASQATEPLSWIPLLHGRRVVFAGDPMQLPPTLHSRDPEVRGGLGKTLLESLQGILPEELQTLLRVQYRMHETIMGFSSERFYAGKLIADENVASHLASQLPGVSETELTRVPLVFVDTAGADYEESFNELLQSRENLKEAALTAQLAKELLDAGIPPEDLAVLTPYLAQVKVLRPLLDAPALEVGTVDGFQGREKEAAVISLVRSNTRGEVGFLSDTRRMNVAVTRARRLLIVVGDSTTIGGHPFYKAFLEYAQAYGEYRSAYEWM